MKITTKRISLEETKNQARKAGVTEENIAEWFPGQWLEGEYQVVRNGEVIGIVKRVDGEGMMPTKWYTFEADDEDQQSPRADGYDTKKEAVESFVEGE
jgi:hypothetical protein